MASPPGTRCSSRIGGSTESQAWIDAVPTLTIALSKGRILDETLPLLALAGIAPDEVTDT